MKYRIFMLLLSVYFIMLLAGCSNAPDKVTIGLIPSNDPQKMINGFEPMRNYLEKEMGLDVEVTVPSDYFGLIDSMKQKKVDIGWYGAFSYIIAEKEIDLEPMVIQYRKGYGTSYHSLIIAHKDTGIKTIEDLKGKKFAFVDPGSTSGFIFPSALFKSRNIDVQQYFSEIKYSGTHDSVALDVITKQADAGAMEDLTFNKMIKDGQIKKDDITVVWQSDEIPGSPFIARADLDNEIKEEFKTAMISIHNKNPEAVKSFDERIEKYIKFDKGLYNGVRNVANILGDDFIVENFL